MSKYQLLNNAKALFPFICGTYRNMGKHERFLSGTSGYIVWVYQTADTFQETQ